MKQSVSDKILSVAGGLFFREGIRTVGIDRIILEASIAKATFYRHFPSKEDLVLAYLNERHARVMEGLEDAVATSGPPRRQIEVIFARLHEKAGNPEFRGCAFALAVAEHGESERIVRLARMHKTAVASLLCGIMRSAGIHAFGAAGSHMALLYDGALAKRTVMGDARPMQDAKTAALFLFDMVAPKQTAKVN